MVGAPNGESCTNTQDTPGISTHLFPSEPSVRAHWVKFVRRHRFDFREPVGKSASLCSAHFEQSCFTNSLASSLPGMEGIKMKRNLIPGSIPTRDTVLREGPQVLSERQKRQVSHFFFHVKSHNRCYQKLQGFHVSWLCTYVKKS